MAEIFNLIKGYGKIVEEEEKNIIEPHLHNPQLEQQIQQEVEQRIKEHELNPFGKGQLYGGIHRQVSRKELFKERVKHYILPVSLLVGGAAGTVGTAFLVGSASAQNKNYNMQ